MSRVGDYKALSALIIFVAFPYLLNAQTVLDQSARSLANVSAKELIEIVDIGVPSVSPNGKYIAVEVAQPDIRKNITVLRWIVGSAKEVSPVTEIGNGGDPIPYGGFGAATVGGVMLDQAAWSPDSNWIYYRRKDTNGIQVWKSRRDVGDSYQVTSVAGDVQAFEISHDGEDLILRIASPISDKATYNEIGYLYDERFVPWRDRAPVEILSSPTRISVVRISDGSERQPTSAEIRDFTQHQELSPGVCSQSHVDFNFDVDRLCLRDLRSDISVDVNPPRTLTWEGKNGKQVVCSVPQCTGYFQGFWLSEDGRQAIFLRWRDHRRVGTLSLFQWTLGSRSVRTILETDDLLGGCSLSNSSLICNRESSVTPKMITRVSLRTGAYTNLIDLNEKFRMHKLGNVSVFNWADKDGVKGYGHVVKPVDYAHGTKYPLVVVQYRSRGFLKGGIGDEYPIQVLAALGFVVLSFDRPDDRDAQMRSRDWTEVNIREWAGLRDRKRVLSVLLAGVEELVREGIVDASRVGISGVSDGADTVSFAVIHTSKVFAAASSAGASWNPIAFFLNGLGEKQLMTSRGLPLPYSEIDQGHWGEISMGMRANEIDTPLLMNVSDMEMLTDTQTVASMKHFQRPVEMWVFPNEHHIKSQPAHRYSVYKRNVQWFQFWLQDVEVQDPVDPEQYSRWRALRDQRDAVSRELSSRQISKSVRH